MYRDKIEELAARARRWAERPDQAPLDTLSWPFVARALWEVLAKSVHELGGVVAMPRSLLTFEGSIPFFSIHGETVRELNFVSLVRAFRLIYDGDLSPRQGISQNALAAVVVARRGIRAVPMLLPAFDDRSTESIMLLHDQPSHVLFDLSPAVRPGGQQPASVVICGRTAAPGADVRDVARRVAGRLDRELSFVPVTYSGTIGRPRNRETGEAPSQPRCLKNRGARI